MAFDVKDPNAQRVLAGQQTPMLQAPGSFTNTTQGSTGEDTTSAINTAKALGDLASDVVGTVVQRKQKEQFMEAYANAGAGMAIQELRKEQPAWETIFGPSATIQGAQARAIENATAELGNKGLAMVEEYKHRTPDEFQAALADVTSNQLTGDELTDKIITQKSVELLPSITAAHYKAHAKYVQDENVHAFSNTVATNLKTFNTLNSTTDETRSESSIEIAKKVLMDSIVNDGGINPDTKRKEIVKLITMDLANGNSTFRDMIIPSLAMDATEATSVDNATDALNKAQHKKVLDGYILSLKQGNDPDVPENLTDEDWLRIDEANGVRDKVIKERYRTERAATRVSLQNMAEAGASTLTLIKKIGEAEDKFGHFDEGDIKSILGAHIKQNAAGVKDQQDVQDFLNHKYSPNGRAIIYTALRKRNPGIQGERMIIDDIVMRNEPGGVPEYTYLYESNLGNPVYPDGKVNPNFKAAFELFQYHYNRSPENALIHLKDEKLRMQYMEGFEALKAGATTPEELVRRFTTVKPQTTKEFMHDPKIASVVDNTVKRLMGGGDMWNLWGFGTKNAENSAYVEGYIKQQALYKTSNGITNPEAAVKDAALIFKQNHENVKGNWIPNGGKPFTQQMGVHSNTVATDDVVDYFLGRQKIKNAKVNINNGNISIDITNKQGISIGIGKPIVMSLKELGSIYNKEVVDPARNLRISDEESRRNQSFNDTIDALMYQAKMSGKPVDRATVIANYNKQQKAKKEIAGRIGAKIGAVTNHFADIADENYKTYENITKGVTGFFNRIIKHSAPKIDNHSL